MPSFKNEGVSGQRVFKVQEARNSMLSLFNVVVHMCEIIYAFCKGGSHRREPQADDRHSADTQPCGRGFCGRERNATTSWWIILGWHVCRMKLPLQKLWYPNKTPSRKLKRWSGRSPKHFWALFSCQKCFRRHFFTVLHLRLQPRFQNFYSQRDCWDHVVVPLRICLSPALPLFFMLLPLCFSIASKAWWGGWAINPKLLKSLLHCSFRVFSGP